MAAVFSRRVPVDSERCAAVSAGKCIQRFLLDHLRVCIPPSNPASIAAELLQLSFRRLLDFLPALFTKPDVGSIGILDRSYTGKSYPPAVRLNRVL